MVTPHEVSVTPADGQRFEVGDRVGFYSRAGDEPIGYGLIKEAATATTEAICAIELHERNQVIVAGDHVRRIDASGRDDHWPGRVDLEISGDKHVSARYKRPAYYGPFVGEGHPVERNEFLIDPLFKLEYGITSRVSVSTIPVADAIKLPNLGVKVGIFDNDFVIATVGLKAIRYLDLRRNVLAPSVLVSFPTNTKLMSHLEVSIPFEVLSSSPMQASESSPDVMAEEQAKLSSSLTTPSLRSFSEYVFDNWDRVAGGPSYDFDLKSVGGSLSYMMVSDHVHLILGVQTRNLKDFRLDLEKAYFPSITMFWRL